MKSCVVRYSRASLIVFGVFIIVFRSGLIFVIVVVGFFVVVSDLQPVVVLKFLEGLHLGSEPGGFEAFLDGLEIESQHLIILERRQARTVSSMVVQVITMLAVAGANTGRMMSRRAFLTSSTPMSRTCFSIFSL